MKHQDTKRRRGPSIPGRGILKSLCLLSVFVLGSSALAADLAAKHMEIVKTAGGYETVFRDSVVIADRDTRITADGARLSESRGVAVIAGSVFIQSPDALIWADSARYLLDSRNTDLYGDVRVKQESLYILAPLLSYSVEERVVRARSGVTVQSEQGDFRLTGDGGTYDLGTETGIVDSNPRMIKSGGRDSVVGTAREMRWLAQESRALASGAVRISSGRTGLDCDTLVFLSARDSGLAWGSPVLHDSSSVARGDTVSFEVQDGKMRTVTIAGNATSQYRTEGGEQVDVAGRSLVITLENGEVSVIEVREMSRGVLVRTGGNEGR